MRIRFDPTDGAREIATSFIIGSRTWHCKSARPTWFRLVAVTTEESLCNMFARRIETPKAFLDLRNRNQEAAMDRLPYPR
jgi:hypothetical protein